MYKQHYNYTVKDVNCDECEGEGLLYRDDSGQLVVKSKAPEAGIGGDEKKYGGMTDDIAMELAKNCGVRKDDSDPLKLNEGNLDLDLPPPF